MGRLAQTLGPTGKILTLSTPRTANPKPDDPSFFEELEYRRTKALVERDLELVERLHSKNYQLITPSGRVFQRDQYLSAIKEAPFYSNWEIADFTCRVASNMAVVRYKARLVFPSGKIITCWHTDTYEQFSGSWQAVWSQATEYSAP